MEAPTLTSLDFDKEFILYTFASNISYVANLSQNNDEGDEVPISFMRSNLQGDELKYPKVEKQGFVVFKAMNHFRLYFPKAYTKIIGSHPIKRLLFGQKKMGER